jgi:type II secretory pathway component HofQ
MRRTNAEAARLAQGLTLALTVMLTMASAGGCRRSASAVDGISETTFVGTMVELRRLDTATTGDSATKAAARAAVLQRRGLTAVQLERYAASLADDPAHAQELFARIDSTVTRGANGGKPLPPPPSAAPAAGPR